MDEKIINTLGLSLAGLMTISQANEVFRLIQIILCCLSAAVVLAYNIYKWYKKAKEDGKITKDELKEGINIVKEGVNDIKEITEKESKDGNNN